MAKNDNTKTFLRCLVTVVWVLATIIVVANAWNGESSGVIDACGVIALAGSIVGIVKFTKDFMGNKT